MPVTKHALPREKLLTKVLAQLRLLRRELQILTEDSFDYYDNPKRIKKSYKEGLADLPGLWRGAAVTSQKERNRTVVSPKLG